MILFMRKAELENRVRLAIERAQENLPTEDSFVEFKGSWIDAVKAARQLAGSCNAAQGESVIWVVGVDEKTGIVRGAVQNELANWWPAVEKEFDAPPPSMIQNIVVDVGEDGSARPVVVLEFESDAAPFVIKAHDQKNGIDREVPWRDGNRTRTAFRRDLLRILVPATKLPSLEVMGGHANRTTRKRDAGEVGDPSVDHPSLMSPSVDVYMARMWLYVTPQTSDPIVFPAHLMSGHLSLMNQVVPLTRIECTVTETSLTARKNASDLIFTGPAQIVVTGYVITMQNCFAGPDAMTFHLALTPAGSDRRTEATVTLSQQRVDQWGIG